MKKEEINSFLKEKSRLCAEATKKYFDDPIVKERIEIRRNLKKFGLALKEGNEGITMVAKEEYFLEREGDENKVVVTKKSFNNKNVVCRYCKGNHMSFKCTQKTKNDNYKKTIKISNLPFDITEDELYDLFYDFGEVERITIPRSIKYRDDMCKYAFVNFRSPKTAEQAVRELDGTKFDYLIINVCLQ
ncbi:RNA recognition motif. (a.k.a. RRM, RBD, or RNP domain) [seawater metagenome]|uniref:RNA recognition motif. (A.k.a. RRM, RBD, or RNP domain) n=1 Tax=seawater metagenome TaxID=1561972 RepID=A0A5E8CHT6_9ZZZZ